MLRTLTLLSLLAAACQAPVDAPSPTGQVWLDESSPLYEAQKAWGMPLPWAPEVVLDFGTREELGVYCGHPGSIPTGCTLGHQVLFAAGETPERIAVSKLHEMGHILAGAERGHIDDPEHCPNDRRGDFVMCTYSRLVAEPTDADFAFVLGQ